MSNLALSYTVGQRFWSNFPTHYDMEGGGGDANVPCVMTVVSMEYIDEEQLPDVYTFFRASFINGKAVDSEISSGTFTEDHVGDHILNVTIDDEGGARNSF